MSWKLPMSPRLGQQVQQHNNQPHHLGARRLNSTQIVSRLLVRTCQVKRVPEHRGPSATCEYLINLAGEDKLPGNLMQTLWTLRSAWRMSAIWVSKHQRTTSTPLNLMPHLCLLHCQATKPMGASFIYGGRIDVLTTSQQSMSTGHYNNQSVSVAPNASGFMPLVMT